MEASAGLGLDAEYVRDAGQAVAHYLLKNRTCELAYMPGNSTLYELVFVPAMGLDAAQSWMDHDRRRSITTDRPELTHEEETTVVLGWIGHGCWPCDLRQVWHDSYIAEQFANCTIGDAAALRALLLAVAEGTHAHPLRAVE